jgi:HD-like signal output (HDOD) protein
VRAEDAFLVGLFQDFGLFALARTVPRDFDRCAREARERGVPIATVIHERLKVDHVELGGLLARHGRLPDHVIGAIELQFDPAQPMTGSEAETGRRYAGIAHLSGWAADIFTESGTSLASNVSRAAPATMSNAR